MCGFRDFLGAFAKLLKATISFFTSVHLYVSTHGTIVSQRTNSHEIWHLSYLLHGAESRQTFHGPRRFVIAFTGARLVSRFRARSLKSMLPLFQLLKTHFHIILPTMPGSSKWVPSLRFIHQNTVYASPLIHTCYMPRPSHSWRFYHPGNIWCGEQIIKLIIMLFSQLTCYLGPLSTKYSPQHPILKHSQPTFLPQSKDNISQP